LTYRKKLIEVALPLDAINKESAHEKMPGIGAHPRGLHLWWARRPLAACRAVLFASLVDDPSNDLPEEEAKEERDRLFAILEELVKWENSNDENVLSRARAEIMRSTGGNPPPVLDPFCGGGSIPLEAQRLGLEAHGSDLNPVAVLITKALIEIPPKFAGEPPVNPESRRTADLSSWRGAQGLAEDVRYYGKWMRDEAEKRIGHLYPKGPNGEAVIAWLWARTVRCPNPACGAMMPLVSSFWLSKKQGKKAWVEPVVDCEKKEVRFTVKKGEGVPPAPPKVSRGAKFRCLVCEQVAEDDHIKAEGKAGRMSQQLMAVVAEARRGREYLAPTEEHVAAAGKAKPEWRPDQQLPDNTRWFSPPVFGMDTYDKLFTPRQLVALTTFSDLVGEAREKAREDAAAAGLPKDGVPLDEGGTDAQAYADAVVTYLGFTVDRCADFNSTVCRWVQTNEKVMNTFARQAIPMVWDYAEANILRKVVGGWKPSVDYIANCLSTTPASRQGYGTAQQLDATSSISAGVSQVVSTDPPYYDNIGYADLSDFFYVWMRRSLGNIYPSIFGTMLVPKSQELVATPYRFGGSRQKAQEFFEKGLGEAFARMWERANPEYPVAVYYAFKQAESANRGDGPAAVASTGWETMLEGLLATGYQITGTWPVRAEQGHRILSHGTNALASSIVLVCRTRPTSAAPATRQEFVRALRRELPEALSVMMAENVAPVDLAQATIGPGMAIYSRYSKVVEADGSPMRVRTALQIINQSLDEYLSQAEGDVDSHTRFAITWFEQHGMGTGPYPDAEGIAKARNVAVRGVVDTGILEARAGKVRLLPREKLLEKWDPQSDGRITDWEVVQYLIRALEAEGEQGAAMLLARIGERGEAARDLAYRLYGICERKKWAEEALSYNALVVAWPEITRLASQNPSGTEPQTTMDF
jgi:putative DNA methylase